MKIALVNQPWNACPPVDGGSIAIWMHEVARRLARDAQVTVYARTAHGQARIATEAGVNYVRLPLRRDQWLEHVRKWLRRGRPAFMASDYHASYAHAVAADIASRGCDIIHVANFSQFVPVLSAANPQAHIVLHMHCEWLSQLPRDLVRARLERASAIVGCSRHVIDRVAERFPELRSRCRAIGNGVDVEQFAPRGALDRRNRRVLFVGRVSPEKGLHVLLDAFAGVVRAEPEATLEIVGPRQPTPNELLIDVSDPGLRVALAPFAAIDYPALIEKRAGVNVSLPGFVTHAQIATVCQRAALLVNPSLSEAFGMSVIEAMACGLPVIASRVGGMVDVVLDGVTGELIAPGNVAELRDAILRLLCDADLRARYGRAGRERAVEVFAWDEIARATRQLYDALSEPRVG